MGRLYKPGEAYSKSFTVAASDGAATDADATPTGTVLVNGATNAATVTISHTATGLYKASVAAIPGSAGDQVELLIAAAVGGVSVQSIVDAIRLTAFDPVDSQRLGLASLPAAGTLAVKPSVTLATADVSGNLPANAVQFAGQTITATTGVTLPASVASQSVAPAWYQAPAAVAQAVWDFAQASLGAGNSMGQALMTLVNWADPWTAEAATMLTPTVPAAGQFYIDKDHINGSITIPCVCAVSTPALRGAWSRVASYDPATGLVVLIDPLPSAPPSGASCTVQFQTQPPGRIDLTQAITDPKTATVGGALAAAWAWAWGRQALDTAGKRLKLWGPGNSTETPTATHALDDAASPTTRTPV